ncbi:MAG TPA: hypothetical protein P5144_10425 [Thermoanaerobaculia bacterium]|mgnify:CR=1 FL=1|nr:hypothetical protein [Thermoanaerobaculia bacterium]
MATNFAEAVIKFTADPGGLSKQLVAIERSVGDAAGRMASAVKTSMLALSGAIAAASGTFAVLVKLSANAGDEIAKLSQRVAIGAETLSGYKLAAELSDLSLQDFGTSLQKASRNIVEASKGTGEAADAFDALGIRVSDNAGKLKTAEQIMLEVADKFAAMEDGAQKTALAMDIFGKSGAGMIPLLNQGSAVIHAQRKEAEQLGATWTTAQATLAETFNDSLTRIEAGLTGFRNQVVSVLLPVMNEGLSRIIAKIKEWGESGQLKIWAVQTAEAIVRGFVWAAQAVAELAKAGALVVESLRLIMAGLRTLETGVETAFGYILKGIEKVAAGLAWWAELWGDPWANQLREIESWAKDVATTFSAASETAAASAVEWWNAVGSGSATTDEFARKLNGMASAFQEFAGTAIAAGVQAGAQTTAVTEAVAKSNQAVIRSAKEQIKELEEAFKVMKTNGEATFADELTFLEQRAALFRAGSKERIQAEAEVFKFAKDMADQLFAHDKAMGLKSLQDEIDRAKQKAAAARQGSAERMKAEEDVYKKEEELRNKRQAAALGILGEVKERLETKGYTEEDVITRDMVEREMFDIQAERARSAARAQRFAAGGGETLADVIAGYQAAGQLNQAQAQQRELGGVRDILAGGADVGVGPMTEAMGGWGAAVTEGYGEAMDAAYTAVDVGLTKIEDRVNQSSSRVAQTIYGNLEEYLVRRIMGQLDRN